jgi:hypothetical protein
VVLEVVGDERVSERVTLQMTRNLTVTRRTAGRQARLAPRRHRATISATPMGRVLPQMAWLTCHRGWLRQVDDQARGEMNQIAPGQAFAPRR